MNLESLSSSEQAQLAALLGKLQPNDATPATPVKPERKKRVPKKLIKYFTEAEIESLFRAIDSPRDLAIFRVAYHRGLRASEIGSLKLSDLNLKDERLNVTRKKGSKGGLYHLTSRELRALRAWLKERGYEDGPLFPSRRGKGISQQMLDVLMKHYGRKAGLPPEKCHIHSLKHSCATHLINRGETLEEVQDHIGHRNPQNTLIYADLGDKRRMNRDRRLRDW